MTVSFLSVVVAFMHLNAVVVLYC